MDKMPGLKLCGRRMCVLILIALNIGCGTAPKPDDSKIQETKRVWQTIPIYPGMTETTENTIQADSPLVFTKTYKSDANYADVETFYTKELAGWRLLEEGEIKDRGRIRGERLQGFTKDNYRLLIQFAGERRTELGWDYAIELSPSNYWKDKVD
jgi:hypothetical protein